MQGDHEKMIKEDVNTLHYSLRDEFEDNKVRILAKWKSKPELNAFVADISNAPWFRLNC